jgi:hypothetical protein
MPVLATKLFIPRCGSEPFRSAGGKLTLICAPAGRQLRYV